MVPLRSGLIESAQRAKMASVAVPVSQHRSESFERGEHVEQKYSIATLTAVASVVKKMDTERTLHTNSQCTNQPPSLPDPSRSRNHTRVCEHLCG